MKEIIRNSIETFYKRYGFVCALEVDETERILNLWEKSLEDEEFEKFFETNYNSLIREFAKAKSLKHFRLKQADDFYGNEPQAIVDFIRENLLVSYEENDLKESDKTAGEWIDGYASSSIHDTKKCSYCGASYNKLTLLAFGDSDGRKYPKYCPNCGNKKK